MNTSTLISTETIVAYKTEMEHELQRILKFWELHGPDREQGGFIGKMDKDGAVDRDAPKGAVLNARILWSFSAAYKHTQNRAHLLLAKRAYDYLLEHFWDKSYGGIYWSLSANGEPLNTRKQVYALAFAIYGLSEYYSITQENSALSACQELFQWIETYSYDPEWGGYYEAFSQDGILLHDLRLSPKDRNDPKTMNTHLHLLEAYTNLYRVWQDEKLALQLEALLEVFLQHIINCRTGHMHLFLSREWRVAAELVSYGHDIEASWLMQEAAEVLGKKDLLDRVTSLAIRMAEATQEGLQPDGSLYHEWDRKTGHFDTHREWWVSAEAMVGYLNAYQLTQEARYWHKSYNAWNFAKKHLLDRERGEWYWGVHEEYSLMKAEDKIGFWKCPYHNSRACLEVIHRCQQLLKE